MPDVIYADHNATTPLSSAAVERMQQALRLWGNPSSVHGLGRKAHEFMEESREALASLVGRHPQEIVFTSGGSEANTLALWGAFLQAKPFRLLTAMTEHLSILDTAKALEKQGAEIAYVSADRTGKLDLAKFEAQLDTFAPHLVSLMTANNETGLVNPVREIASLCEKRNIPFHTDAVQALGKLPAETFQSAPLISLSAHKIGGPKGVGALVIKKGLTLQALHFGGAQEIKRRGGTENTIGIAGFGGACRELKQGPEIEKLRDTFEATLLARIPDAQIICYGENRVGNTTLVRFPGILADVMLSTLDLNGLCASAGSACSSGSISPSHVLLAMGYSGEEAREALRFSWGTTTSAADIERAAELVIAQVERIRARRKAC